jgi:hypothetical protein
MSESKNRTYELYMEIMLNSSDTYHTQHTNTQRRNNTPELKVFIRTLTLNFNSGFPLAIGALFYNIGQSSIHPSLTAIITIYTTLVNILISAVLTLGIQT